MPFSKEKKQEVLNLLHQGYSYQVIEETFNVPTAVVILWREQMKKNEPVHHYPEIKISARMLLKDIYLYPTAFQHQRAMRFKCSQQAVQKAMVRLGITKHNKCVVISTLRMSDIEYITGNNDLF